jgi:hypothetical protein
MIEDAAERLTQRLHQLEEANTWWRRASLGTFAAVALVVLAGQANSKDKVVEAERIVLKDATGRIRATTRSALDKSSALLQFYGSDGNPQAGLGILVACNSRIESGTYRRKMMMPQWFCTVATYILIVTGH